MSNFTSVTKLKIGDQVIEPTTQHGQSHYGIPVWPGVTGPLAGEVGIYCESDEPEHLPEGRDTFEATVCWSDKFWAILSVPDYDTRFLAIHLETGGVYDFDIPDDPPAESELVDTFGRWVDEKSINVRGAIPDWTGETLALVMAF